MSLTNIITKCRESKSYFRKLIIRAIEDACVLLAIIVLIWALCAFASTVLGSMGVL